MVLGGGSVTGATIEANANLVVNGGADVSATILSGALETISAGSASGDQIYGSVVVSAGGVSNETVQSGGQLTVDPGKASNTLLNGGATLDLTGPDATLSGSLTFANGDNTLLVSALSNPGAGDQAVISGFSTSDKIDISGISLGASIGYAAGANNTEIVTVSGTGGSESFTFNNQTTYGPGTMAVYSDGGSGVDLVEKTTPVVTFTSLNNLTTNQATEIVNGTVNVAVDPEAIGTVVTVDEGNNAVGTATVQANGYWSANVTFQNDSGANVLTATDTDLAGQTGVTAASLTTNVNTAAAACTAGDLVVSVYGDGSGTGNYTLDQAAPISLDQITTSGTIVSQTVLPETTSTVNGVTEYLISGEYGSASEGALQLSADGHSLTIVGYGVNYQAFDASNSAATCGNAALGQSITLTSDTAVTLVPRVVADINASGVIDTSTALYNIYDSNNPRSVATVNGTAFYLSGQGVKGSTNQGVFYAADGASSATAISTATDTRVAEIYNGQLYVSADSTQGATNITDYGSVGTVTSSATATPVVLNGLGPTVTLGGGNGNAINGSTGTVNLSPESFFFANPTTLYVADGGLPKNGGVGDGGLQKWVENAATGTWTLEYTLSAGLNLQNSTTALSGVSGLFGLTGQVVNGQVQLFASSSTIGELDQSYLYSITDSLTSTTGTGESFSTVLAASSNEIIRGVSFAPTASSTPCYCAGTLILTDRGEVAVENLAIGDHVKTLGGDAKPIKWIGTRSYDGRFVGANREILPICVRAGALDDNKPSRDLWVSPHHALYLEGVLIEAKDLVNGASIVQAEKIERVDYFHIELFNHDVMFAEGAAAESFIDNDSRAMFQNVADYFALYSDSGHKKRKTPSFAPRRDEGFEIEAARKSIETRAGIVTTSTPGALHGWVEGMSSEGLWGWAQDSSDPQNPVCLHVYADDCVIGRVLANRFRPDLMEAGLGFGRHAFRFEAPKGVDFSKVRIELRRASDGAPLPCPAQCAA